jgi:hypothetical protein
MKTIEQIEAEIAALQAELEARKSEPDFSEVVDVFRAGKAELIAARKAEQRWEPANEVPDPTMDEIELYGLIAAYPALHKVLGPRSAEPTEEDDKFLAWQVCVDAGYKHPHTREHHLAIAAIQSERKRAGGA